MAGHSKWANIKHRKAAQDAKKGKYFTKIASEIAIAAKVGGSDADMNPRLRVALEKAKMYNLPKDNIERAIKKGTGEGNENNFDKIFYEGYGPGGFAILIEVLTDNKNRSVSAVRSILNRRGGSLGESGSVSWMFDRVGLLQVDKSHDEGELLSAVLDVGADDLDNSGDNYTIYCTPHDFINVKSGLEEKGFGVLFADVVMDAKNTISVNEEEFAKALILIDALEDLDDVQDVYTNLELEEGSGG